MRFWNDSKNPSENGRTRDAIDSDEYSRAVNFNVTYVDANKTARVIIKKKEKYIEQRNPRICL